MYRWSKNSLHYFFFQKYVKIRISENHIDSSKELFHLPKIPPANKSEEINKNLSPEIAEKKKSITLMQ